MEPYKSKLNQSSQTRKNFETYFDAKANKQVPKQAEFAEFLDLVIDGYTELAKFMDKNSVRGESFGMDTGMVDGKGKSKYWNTYWNYCGVCNPETRPDIIMHLDHFQEDLKAS